MNLVTANVPTSIFAPRRIAHVNLWVSNVSESEKFYRDVCGLKVEFTEQAIEASFLGTGHTPHDVGIMATSKGYDRRGRDGQVQIPKEIGLVAGLNHFAWEVETERALVDGYRRLLDMGIKNRPLNHQVAHSLYLVDPDGNTTELYSDTIRDWRSMMAGSTDSMTSDWDPLKNQPTTDPRYDDDPRLNPQDIGLMRPWRFTHAAFGSRNPEEMALFYTEIVGLKVLNRLGDVLYLGAGLSSYQHGLVIFPSEQPALSHFAFQLRDDQAFDASLAQLSTASVKPLVTLDLPNKRAVFLQDPDGLLVEFYVRRPGIVSASSVEETRLAA